MMKLHFNADLRLRGDEYNAAQNIATVLKDCRSIEETNAYLRHMSAVFKGDGMYADVYGLSGIAVKVSLSQYDGNYSLDYVKAVVEGRMHGYLKPEHYHFIPKIYGYMEYQNEYTEEEFFVVFMEELTDIKYNENDMPNKLRAMYISDVLGQPVYRYKGLPITPEDLAHMTDKELRLACRSMNRQVFGVNSAPKEIVALLEVIRAFAQNFENITKCGEFDMHCGNYMQRANGEIVITDPIA